MKLEFDLSPDEILDLANRSDRRVFFERLEEEFEIDIEDSVDRATVREKQRIFDNLLNSGYGDDFIDDCQSECPKTIENKRFMMDKADDDMLMYLIEKYKYFN